MKKFVLLILLSILILPSCDNEIPVTDPLTDCPLWYPIYGRDTIYIDYPKGQYSIQGCSRDGLKLAFNGYNDFEVLDLRTGYIQTYLPDYFKNKLPPNVIYRGGTNLYWCPYDNNRLLMHSVTFTDTDGDGKNYEWGQNLYITSLDGKEFKKVTPTSYGPAGGDFHIISWLEGSSPNEDYILFGGGKGVYIPQKDQWIPQPAPAKEGDYIVSVSPNNQYYLLFVDIGNYERKYVLNDVDLNFLDTIGEITHESWSPDSKKLALSLFLKETDVPDQKRRFMEIWIIDVEKLMQERPAITPVSIINIRRNFCMYSYDISAEFISNNSLAVSMWGPNENFGHIYEISTSGEMIRKLVSYP
ncbi:MAG TPA: hypothetical protein PLC04_05495 [Candidatus Kapabacteria bacterium]|nr:hypothetical protein [Candidatus Kapabacteria bacterium]